MGAALDLLQRDLMLAEHHLRPAGRRGPHHRVLQHELDIRLIVDREGFVAGAEVEDLARSPMEAAAAAEDFAAGKPAHEDQRVGRRDVEALAVHLHVRNLDVFAQALRDGVSRLHDPEPLFLAGFAPLQIARGSHQALENLGEMAGVEDDEAHAVQHALIHAVDNLILHVAVRHVAPPDQHVGVVQHLLRQAVLRLDPAWPCRQSGPARAAPAAMAS